MDSDLVKVKKKYLESKTVRKYTELAFVFALD